MIDRSLTRRTLARQAAYAAASVGLLGVAPALAQASGKAGAKVLRYVFPVAETGFDPARIVDLYSRIVTAHIFESLYTYDPLARPVKIKPVIAEGMPQHSEDFRIWTVKIRPGIFFADDPAFSGKKREVTAADFVYALKRFADPANKSPVVAGVLDQKYIGLAGLRQRALKEKKPFDYDTEIEGIRALDRYTLQFKLEEPRPRFGDTLAAHDLFGAVAREVVEKYGDAIPAHPVGTGPFRLAQWRRSSLIVLERNPHYREVLYDENPPEGDAARQATAARLKGRKLPLVDRVEIAIIEETQPRWLSFLNAGQDLIEQLPAEFTSVAIPNNQLAPNLKKRGLQMERYPRADVAVSYFGMENAVVGGYEPHKVALRRAIALGVDLEREIRLVRRNQAIPGQGPIGPETYGYEAAYKSEMSTYDL